MNYKVTVVTVAFNALPALQCTATNVLKQDFGSFEYVVVDGGSSDGTVSYLQALSKDHEQVRWISEPDKGIFDAMNKGVGMAQGEWIIFMNAGDLFANDTVMHDIFDQGLDLNADLLYGDVIKNGTIKPSCPPRNCHRMFFCHQSSFARRSLLQEIPFDIRHKMSADIKFVKQVYLAGKPMRYVALPIAIFDTTGVSNANRSAGLLDNIHVVREVDSWVDQLRFLPHLVFPYLFCRLRGK